MQHRLTKEQREQVPALYLGGKSCVEIAAIFKVSAVAICGLLKRRGIKRRSLVDAARKCNLDESAFDVLTTQACYWAGFIFADGCLFQRGGSPSLTVRLAQVDREHVHKLAAFLGSSHKILDVAPSKNHPKRYANTTVAVQFSVRSSRLVERLRQLGCNGLNSNPCPELRASRDFWRGVVDGDGCIGRDRQNRARLEVVGGSTLLEELIEYIRFIDPRCNCTVRPHKGIFRVGLCGRTAAAAIKYLYSDCSVSLERKQRNAAKNIGQEADRMFAAGIINAPGIGVSAGRGGVSRKRGRKPSVHASAIEAGNSTAKAVG